MAWDEFIHSLIRSFVRSFNRLDGQYYGQDRHGVSNVASFFYIYVAGRYLERHRTDRHGIGK